MPYDRWRTPYNVGPANDMDLPTTRLGVMVKPSRSGGTTVAENLIFKAMLHGPMGHIGWYLNSDDAVKEYCRTIIAPMFDENADLAARVGTERGEDNATTKRVAGYPVEFLAAKDGNFRNREPLIMICDETDAWDRKYAASPRVQIEARQKNLGDRRKAMVMSHPDRGWDSGSALAWMETSRGIYIGRCPECRLFAAFHATKLWPTTPQFRLHYHDLPDAEADERLAMVGQTAGMLCPHCGALLDDDQRRAMVDEALAEGWGADGWMHRGQTLDPSAGIQGERELREDLGWWVHGLMVKPTNMSKLARDLVAATDLYERTRDPKQVRELMSKQMGEIFEGRATVAGINAQSIAARAENSDYRLGEVPPEVMFITAAVDPGGRKFDVLFRGWDLEGRSWVIDRMTIRQRLDLSGQPRDIDNYRRIEDWLLLIDQVVLRTFPMMGRPGWQMPVAVVLIDDGDGNATHLAREFMRRTLAKRMQWGEWTRVKLIKGARIATAPILPVAPRKVDRDEQGRQVAPVFEFDLGVDRLKELTHEQLAVIDGGPGACRFPVDIDGRHVRELFAESLIDGKWVRGASRANETLDLFGYTEAGRRMLEPDKADRKWGDEQARPIWARPIAPDNREGGDPSTGGGATTGTAGSAPTLLDQLRDLHR